jgi:methylmalonyl-CoA epimerase
MFKKFNHVSHVVKNLDEALKMYSDILHLKPWDIGVVTLPKEQGVRMVWLPIGDNFIELIEPVDEKSRFARSLKERGEGFFHISILAEDFEGEVKALKEKGYKLDEESFVFLPQFKKAKVTWLSPAQSKGAWIEIVDITTLPS